MALHLTNELAYWHMPKTGGMSVYRVLRECSPSYLKVVGIRRHGPISSVPLEHLEGRTLFGTVRDPWAWYASLYQHAASGDGDKLKKWGRGDLSFKAALKGWTHPEEASVENQFGVVWSIPEEEAPQHRETLLESGAGLYSWVFNYVYGDPPRPTVLVDTSRLTEGLACLLKIPAQEMEQVHMQNRAKHRPQSAFKSPRSEYDAEMCDWVIRSEAALVNKFEFTPFQHAESALHLL